MHPLVELNLALILFLPWYAILGGVFWFTRPRPWRRRDRLFDAGCLLAALLAAAWGGYWSFRLAAVDAGAIWKQVLASSVGYGLYLGVLLVGFLLRRWRTRRLPS